MKFCTNVVKKLVNMEKGDYDQPSTMKKLVRVDLGVMKVDGKYHYFVNEVTRALEMNLFSRTVRNPSFVKIIGHLALDSIKELIAYKQKIQ